MASSTDTQLREWLLDHIWQILGVVITFCTITGFLIGGATIRIILGGVQDEINTLNKRVEKAENETISTQTWVVIIEKGVNGLQKQAEARNDQLLSDALKDMMKELQTAKEKSKEKQN